MHTVGLAGKPNAGKTTFFRAATEADAEVGNYPFTTIDANRGVAYVRTECPCGELEERCGDCRDGRRYVAVQLVDVAGLVPDAHLGRGLGNQFLDELRRADSVLHVVDASGGTDEEGEPVERGEHDPVRDVEFLPHELTMWIAGVVRDNRNKVVRQSKTPDFDLEDALADVLTGVGATHTDVRAALREADLPANFEDWEDPDYEEFAGAIRRRTKPTALAANKADNAPQEFLERLLEHPYSSATSAEMELALRNAVEAGVVDYHPGDQGFEVVGEVSGEQREALDRIRGFVEELGGTGVQEALNTAVYELLDVVTVYPVEDASKWSDGSGSVLPDAFLLPRGSTPRDLAYMVHTDVGEGYLHAVDARSGQRIGDDYELEEGAVVKIESTA